jgi:hypothetical protein
VVTKLKKYIKKKEKKKKKEKINKPETTCLMETNL